MGVQEELSIVAVDRHDGDQIFVSFSDGTSAFYTVQQLVELAPNRTLEEPQPDE